VILPPKKNYIPQDINSYSAPVAAQCVSSPDHR
jgi:hypothetical protein